MDDEKILNDLLNHKSSSLNGSANMSDSFQESSDSDIDYMVHALVHGSDNETQSTSVKSSNQINSSQTEQLNLADLSSEFEVQSVINSQILEQLQQIGKRLDKIENGGYKKTSNKSKIKGAKSLPNPKKVVSKKSNQQTETFDCKLQTFDSVREDAIIQTKVECLQELTEFAKTGTNQKLKSQKGGNVEVMVKNRNQILLKIFSTASNMARLQNLCLAHILIKEHVHRKNPMRPGRFFISIFVLHVLHQQERHFIMLKWIAKINKKVIQKMIKNG